MAGPGDNGSVENSPNEGYFGTNRIRSGRGVPIPSLFFEYDYLTVGDTLKWAVDQHDCPVFSLDRTFLKREWKSVGTQTIREDHQTPVVQIPGRFFDDFDGNSQIPESLRQQPVREAARLNEKVPLHFIRRSRSGGQYIQLLTWREFSELPTEELDSLFPHMDQRIEFMDNVTYKDCTEHESYVFSILEDLFGGKSEAVLD